MENKFYVYEWYNKDTDEVFYVGKGTGSRYKNITQRNKYFKNYYKKYNCDVRKIKEFISESEAFEIENELIKKYREIDKCKCNLIDGGRGGTSEGNPEFKLLRQLKSSKYCETDHSILDNLTFVELIKEDEEREFNKASNYFLESLEIYDENGELNIGWECFED